MNNRNESYKSKECGETFIWSSCLIHHLRTQSELMPMECKKFEKAFPCSPNLAKLYTQFHMREKHCVCKECSKEFTRFPKLNIHMWVHTGEKPYECSKCQKTFTDFSDLIKHKRTHTGKKPYECKEYGKALLVPHTLLYV